MRRFNRGIESHPKAPALPPDKGHLTHDEYANHKTPRYGVEVLENGILIAVHAAPDVEGLLFHIRDPLAPDTIQETYALGRNDNQAPFSGSIPNIGPGCVYSLQATYLPYGECSDDLLDPYSRATLRRPNGLNNKPRAYSVIPQIDGALRPGDNRPNIDPAKRVIYEAHIKSDTQLNPYIPENLRGTYLGFAHPENIKRLKNLGITTVEFLPLQQPLPEPFLAKQGKENYWGYSPIGFFAPHEAYATDKNTPGAAVNEFKQMVYALHEAGLEVVMDVVYNHTAEGSGSDHNADLSLRGLDYHSYYHAHDRTGCGNMLDLNNKIARRLVMDSLRYWSEEMGIDGFRFDLATALIADENNRLNPEESPFLQEIRADPILRNRLLIAEPWDATEFPNNISLLDPMKSWNAFFRDTIRLFFNLHSGDIRQLAHALAGSGDPEKSINFITAHDGMTLHDLVTYYHKENSLNGEENRDGANDNKSSGHGVHGPSDNPEVTERRLQAARNMITATILAAGTPMILAGDEVMNTQFGNNNPYMHDNEINWIDRRPSNDSSGDYRKREMAKFFTGLIAIRQSSDLGNPNILNPGGKSEKSRDKRIIWLNPDGSEKNSNDWGYGRLLGMYISGTHDPQGQSMRGLLTYFNGENRPIKVSLPAINGGKFTLNLNTSTAVSSLAGYGEMPSEFLMPPHSIVTLVESSPPNL